MQLYNTSYKNFYDVCHQSKMIFSRPDSRPTIYTLIALLGLIAGLAGCASPADATAIQQPATELAPPSPTFVWFPPSATPAPRAVPTQHPTPEQKPGVGSPIFSDDFSSPILWNTAVSNQAAVDVSRNRLTIAVQPGIYMLSLRQGVTLSSFYAEVTARPSLCQGKDEYGMLVRAIPVAYYRFALSCDGTARAERVSLGTREPLHSPQPSGDIPPGAPGEVRIGVWAVGSEMRLFLNGRYQFSVNDKNYLSGALGVFARSAGDTPVTITFSDLVVYDVSYSPPTKTPKP